MATTLQPLPSLLKEHRVSFDHPPAAKGKFFFFKEDKFYVRGVTYGPFRPDADGNQYHTPDLVGQDFAQMAAHGINAVRTYTAPPIWLLDIAQEQGLRVMAGLPWEQHVTFLDDRKRRRSIEEKIRAGARLCGEHPAVFSLAVGNEIPAPIVRWYGRTRIQNFIHRLYAAAKDEAPRPLITYVNYPTTEYLELPFLDYLSFNVYLESRDRLKSYLSRLQNLAGERPLVMAEVGLDSNRNGQEGQAHSVDWQTRTAFESGCAGVFVFSWTDEWHRGGEDIEDWDFGLTDRERQPKQSLSTTQQVFSEVPFEPEIPWPRISVAVCVHNGETTTRECLEGLSKLNYPDYEIIFVDDGSTDQTLSIAREFNLKLVTNDHNQGLSSARNAALHKATGEIIAYIDGDAYPDPDWLRHLAHSFLNSEYMGVGGPNIVPPLVDPVEFCVAHAPGGPNHVLLSDVEAEHIPGCNMAFRREALAAIGGFDPQFWIAGDDVDICWRIQQQGWVLGFNPSALVWHHRRTSVGSFWKQQLNYGKAEAMLERKWPEKYNRFAHPVWEGQIYGNGSSRMARLRSSRVYHGVWGSGLFQSVYGRRSGALGDLASMPEWLFVVLILAGLSGLGVFWKPLLLAIPLFFAALTALLLPAASGALKVILPHSTSKEKRVKLIALTFWLHILQPLARLVGRLKHDLTPWKRRGVKGFKFPWPKTFSHWSESWKAPVDWLNALETDLLSHRAAVVRGGDFDRWDMEVWCGTLGGVRLVSTVEEHGSGKQMLRFHLRPRVARATFWLIPAIPDNS